MERCNQEDQGKEDYELKVKRKAHTNVEIVENEDTTKESARMFHMMDEE